MFAPSKSNIGLVFFLVVEFLQGGIWLFFGVCLGDFE